MNKGVLVGAGSGIALAVLGGAAWLLHVQPVARAQDAVRRELKDPESAKFEHVTVFAGGTTCGRVNAKTAFGGYGGFQEFVLYPTGQLQILPAGNDDEQGVVKVILAAQCRDK